jgi:hypothetical protein
VVVSIAFYNEAKHSPFVPPREYVYDPWWWVKTRGGLVPPGPPPGLQEFGAALAMADAATSVSPRLHSRVLEVALEQLSIASETIKQQVASLQNKQAKRIGFILARGFLRPWGRRRVEATKGRFCREEGLVCEIVGAD